MFLVNILGNIMEFCYNLFGNYGWAIVLFTIFSKIVLLPITIWVQKNSIKMVKMQPEINQIKINYFGDKDRIAEEQTKLYKREKYNAFVSLIPLVVQILLLLGLVEVINHPLTYIAKTDNNLSAELVSVALENDEGLDSESSSLELTVVEDIKNGRNIEQYSEKIDNEQMDKIKSINLDFFGFDMGWIATREKGIAILIPIIAGLSALVMCVGQNIMNVLQAEQSKANQWGMLILSVGLSLYLGAFVPAGVGLYWTASNLLAVLQQWLLNIFISPKKYVDYDALEKTSKQLKELAALNNGAQKRTKEQKKKEKDDYKRFFSVVNKHLVFYSESNGFYKYYKGIIEYLLNNTNITIHYITSDFNDKIFEMEKQNEQIKAYYIEEKKLITLMMKMDADVVVMTMPDIQNYHIKRSYVRKDIEYVYIPHGMDSTNLTMRKGSTAHYDTIFVTGKYQKEEEEKNNEVYNLQNRKIVEWGYSVFDDMLKNYEENKEQINSENSETTVLIAPSWQKDNIIDLCLEDILNSLKGKDYKVIVRPHPQQVRHMKDKFENMKEQYKDDKNIEIQTDFSSNKTVYSADLVITDWSSIANEFAYTTKKPVLFVDTPMKIMNPEYEKIGIEPINIWSRNVMGEAVPVDECNKIDEVVEKILKERDNYKEKIENLVNDSVYNIGHSAEVGANYIIEAIQNKIQERKEEN
ncbi:MAG: membrane protein insertase YidC [Clostridia bacterium]|nr:membrane protein insertase YidC [Clostridia bacterium]